ncbi:MAG TPA: hypothetical protein VE573_05535 [Nitrososphaeraceae archaeon]|nr:hypothetical protein [Nitrososphaeraceae archaeon]
MADSISSYLSLIQFIVERFEAYRNRAQLEREREASRILQSANILAVSVDSVVSRSKDK